MTEAPKPLPGAVNKIFGEELPQISADELDDDSPVSDSEHDAWLRDNIPPHHE